MPKIIAIGTGVGIDIFTTRAIQVHHGFIIGKVVLWIFTGLPAIVRKRLIFVVLAFGWARFLLFFGL